MLPFTAQPIRRQIIVVSGLLLIPFTIGLLVSAVYTRREREAEIRESAGAIAVTAAAYLNQYLNGVDSLASALTRHPAVLALDRPQCDTLFAEILHDQPLFLNIILSDRNGVIKGSGQPTQAGVVDVRFGAEGAGEERRDGQGRRQAER